MRRKFSSALKYIFFLALGLFLLWFASKDVNFNEVKVHFNNANYWWIGVSLACTFISHFSRAIRWNMLIAALGHKPHTSKTFFAVMIGYFINMAIPRGGEIARCGSLSAQERIPLNSLIGTIIVERGIDLITLVIILALTVLFQLDLLGSFLFEGLKQSFSGIGGSIGIWAITGILAILLGYLMFRIAMAKLRTSPIFFKIKRLIVGFMLGVKTIRKMKNPLLFVFHSILIWLMYTLMIYFVFFAIEPTSHLTLIDGLTVMIMGSLGIIVPVPGGIGSYHLVVSTTLQELFFIAEGSALAFAWVVFITQTFFILTIGGVSFLMLFLSRRKTNIFNEKA